MSGSMQSNVGNRQLYEAGDQRPDPQDVGQHKEPQERFEAGQPNSHSNLDSKDQRSLGNRLAAAQQQNTDENDNSKTIQDPLAPARSQGHEPSRGAKIDAELQADDEEYLKNKNK